MQVNSLKMCLKEETRLKKLVRLLWRTIVTDVGLDQFTWAGHFKQLTVGKNQKRLTLKHTLVVKAINSKTTSIACSFIFYSFLFHLSCG